MAILRVVPKTPAECNQLISILHSKRLEYLSCYSSKPTSIIKPNEPVCIWANLCIYEANRDGEFPRNAQTITVNQLASKLK
ncbi:hypothetical protein APK81_21 [Acinetobacter phage vB_AbaP_APK81]|uniref:Uncharacterized protein n=1 Tax=Acinetobacter phage vB_AbaP_APK81 TaxID=2759217 RepID=A0A7G9VYH5_9CAUD|nr:hypothetical protein APK81_21 [Acinetobacter phage vB_AbaP_APK81]